MTENPSPRMLRGRCGEDEGVYGNHNWRRPLGTDRVIYGVDFSGAKDAGNKIWVAKAVPDGKRLLVSECYRARDLPNSGKGPDACSSALADLIRSETNAAFGFDFPFGLPTPLVEEKSWEDFVLGFPSRYKSPEAFRQSCRQANRGRKLKRKTDTEARTPFSPYNLRLFKQTYYGISEILFPILQDSGAYVLPFYEPIDGKPWILEVCPASTLKRLMKDGVPSYKGPEEDKRENRRQILGVVKNEGVVLEKDVAIEKNIIDNKGGDALDSVIAALAVFSAIQNQDALIPEDEGYWKIEGYVYP